jgi:hypothetical protein
MAYLSFAGFRSPLTAASENVRSVVEEVHNAYAMRCPLYRTLHRCIDLKISYELAPAEKGGESGGE